MQVKNKTRLITELAKSVENPWEFVEALIALEGLHDTEAAEKIGVSVAHLYVLRNEKKIGLKVGLKISEGFGINPQILNRVIADYNLKVYQESLKQ